MTCISEDQRGSKLEDVKKWESDYLELMEYVKNPTYGRLRCFHCLLSPAGDDPILIGINRLVSKGLIDGEQCAPEYPCQVVNRFQCPYKRTNVKEDRDIEAPTPDFDVDDLFRLHKMAFIVRKFLIEHELGRRIAEMLRRELILWRKSVREERRFESKEPVARFLKSYAVFISDHTTKEDTFFDIVKDTKKVSAEEDDLIKNIIRYARIRAVVKQE